MRVLFSGFSARLHARTWKCTEFSKPDQFLLRVSAWPRLPGCRLQLLQGLSVHLALAALCHLPAAMGQQSAPSLEDGDIREAQISIEAVRNLNPGGTGIHRMLLSGIDCHDRKHLKGSELSEPLPEAGSIMG